MDGAIEERWLLKGTAGEWNVAHVFAHATPPGVASKSATPPESQAEDMRNIDVEKSVVKKERSVTCDALDVEGRKEENHSVAPLWAEQFQQRGSVSSPWSVELKGHHDL